MINEAPRHYGIRESGDTVHASLFMTVGKGSYPSLWRSVSIEERCRVATLLKAKYLTAAGNRPMTPWLSIPVAWLSRRLIHLLMFAYELDIAVLPERLAAEDCGSYKTWRNPRWVKRIACIKIKWGGTRSSESKIIEESSETQWRVA